MEKEPTIYCSYNALVSIENLKPNPRNPNKHPEKQIEMLAFIIQQNGWRAPITVSKQSGFIVKGHGRLEAAKSLGLKKVPVDYQDYENESLELADLLADNRIAELSKNDNRMLLNLFEEFDTGAVNFELSGYTEDEYKDLAHSFDEYEPKNKEDEEDEEETKEGTTKITSVIYPNCGEVFEVKK